MSFSLRNLSRIVARLEAGVAVALVMAIALLLFTGTVARAMGSPMIRSDEAAVLAMVWVAFIGASLGVRERTHMAIALLPDRLSASGRRWVARAAAVLTAIFLLSLGAMLWAWFDLPGLLRTGGAEGLARETFNYIYTEPTQTLGVPKFWFWLVMPFSTACALLHLAAGWE